INFFFFQAEDGIRDRNVTGVQTCALPILVLAGGRGAERRAPCRRARLGGQLDRVAEARERRQTGCAQQASLGPRVPGLAGSQERGGGARGLTARAPRTSVLVCHRRSSGLV